MREATKHQHTTTPTADHNNNIIIIIPVTLYLRDARPKIHLANVLVVEVVHEHHRKSLGAIVGHLLPGWPEAQTQGSNVVA